MLRLYGGLEEGGLVTVYRPEDRAAQRSRDLAIRLFEYLQKLAELRARPVRDLADYAETLWFDDIPPEPECRVITGSPPSDPLAWVSLDRPRQAAPPPVPEALAPWLDQREIHDSNADLRLRHEADLVTRVRTPDGEEVDRLERHRLEQHPEIVAGWGDYRRLWERWAVEQHRLEPVVTAYTRLFQIEQLANQLGEQYETVIGLGLLTWTGPAGTVRRHLLTMPAQVRFEAETGGLTIGSPPEGTRLRFEEDMLEGDQLPSRELVRSLSNRIEELGAAPWDQVATDAVLQAWTHAAHTRGVYDPHRDAPHRQ